MAITDRAAGIAVRFSDSHGIPRTIPAVVTSESPFVVGETRVGARPARGTAFLGEEPPKGFGFSDTAFRVFIVMASRRLKSDRFFTEDYRPEVFSPAGLAWVRDTDLKTILLRHYPLLTHAVQRVCDTGPPEPASTPSIK